jgi:hypothetical protein
MKPFFFFSSIVLLLLIGCTEGPLLIQPDWQQSTAFSIAPYDFSLKIGQNPDLDAQAAGVNQSFIGNYGQALHWFDEERAPVKKKSLLLDTILQTYHFTEAIPHILERAEAHEMLIINEAHHISLHRVFTQHLLQGLYDRGYRHFGLETLNTQPAAIKKLNENGRVSYDSGYYTRDPRFAELIRTAQRIGFHLFPYESLDEAQEREAGQAENIAAYIGANPNGKVLIHCGYDHGAETSFGGKTPMMAGKVATILDLDPLTINQSQYTERSTIAFDDPLLSIFDAHEPSVLINESGDSFSPWLAAIQDGISMGMDFKMGMDIYVFHPSVKLQHGRPDFFFSDHLRPFQIDLSKSSVGFPALLYVFQPGDDRETTVPFDVVEVNGPEVVLGLPKGPFELVLIDGVNSTEEAFIEID